MRFTTLLVVGAFAFFANAQSSTSSTASSVASTTTTDSAQSSEIACLDKCAAGDVSCQSKCIGVPDPSGSQANATTECVGNCPQGNGTAAETQEYASCVQKCIDNNYYTSSGTPAESTSASGSSSSGSSASATGTSGSSSSSTGTSSSSSASASSSGSAADTIRIGMSGVGLLGFLAAAIAL